MIECTDSNSLVGDEDFDNSLFDDDFSAWNVDNHQQTRNEHQQAEPVFESINAVIIKSAKTGAAGSKLRRKALRTSGGIDNNAAVNSVQYRKVVKRRCAPKDSAKAILYVFPSFDRSDALLFLPSTLATHLNTANFKAMTKLLQTNFDKNCKVSMPYGAVDGASLLTFHRLKNEVHPDCIFCVHSTKVIENQIHASLYSKYTSSKSIHNAVLPSVKDPLFKPFFGVERTANLRKVLDLPSRTEEERNNFTYLLNMDTDLLMYVHLDLVLTIDDFTKKITNYDLSARVTSVEPVNL